MIVSELIERLQKVDQDSVVMCYAGYDMYYGAHWEVLTKMEVEQVGWDKDRQCSVVGVFIQ